jgi:hypothetical protein
MTTKEKNDHTHAMGIWSVVNIRRIVDANGKVISFTADVQETRGNPADPNYLKTFPTGIKVTSEVDPASVQAGDPKPLRYWKTNDYKEQEEKVTTEYEKTH